MDDDNAKKQGAPLIWDMMLVPPTSISTAYLYSVAKKELYVTTPPYIAMEQRCPMSTKACVFESVRQLKRAPAKASICESVHH